jgi:hypothetical protein
MYASSTLYLRIVAMISLLLGLSDAARVLGVSMGAASPIAALGTRGFAYLGAFALAQLFAAVGLWMKASWGGLVLVLVTAGEIALYFTGDRHVDMSATGLALRIVLLVAVLVIFALSLRLMRASARD